MAALNDQRAGHGESWAGLRLEGLWVYDGWVPTTGVWSHEIRVPAGVFFVLKGRGRIVVRGKETEVPAGSAFFAGPGLRRQWFADGTRLLSVGFRANWRGGAPLFPDGMNFAGSAVRTRALRAATGKLFRRVHGNRSSLGYHEALRRSPDSLGAWVRRERAFLEWFEVYVRTVERWGVVPGARREPMDERLREVLERLDRWPLERALQRRELVSGLGLGVRRMEQLLMKESGLTPQRVFDRRRMTAACEWLGATAVPLKQIAHRIGFRQASHFTKWFRRHAGGAPSVYRKGGGEAL